MSRIPLSQLTDREIHSLATDMAAKDRLSTLGMLRVISEVERRQFFIPLGFTSIFDYCTRHLKFASSSAMRRIEVARVLRRFPDTALLLESGDVNLSTLSLVADVLTEENHKELLEKIRGKSQREVEGIVCLHKPPVKLKDRVRPVMVAVETTAAAGGPDASNLGQTSQNPRNSLILHSSCGSEAGRGAAGLPQPCTQTPATAASSHRAPTRTSHPAPTRTVLQRKFQIQFLAGPDFMKKLEKARALLSNRLDEPTFERVFEAMMDEFLERQSPESKAARREKRRARRAAAENRQGSMRTKDSERTLEDTAKRTPKDSLEKTSEKAHDEVSQKAIKDSSVRTPECADEKHTADGVFRGDPDGPRSARPFSRHIPAAVRDAIFTRDKGRCTYVSPNGERCGATHHVQIDHIEPFARGGSSAVENLRLLCGRHNRLEARRVYGADKMRRFRRRD